MEQKNCTLFEAAIKSGHFLIQVDTLIKKGKRLKLIRVKAKLFYPGSDSFITNKSKICSNWMKYLIDVVFQKMVLKQVFTE